MAIARDRTRTFKYSAPSMRGSGWRPRRHTVWMPAVLKMRAAIFSAASMSLGRKLAKSSTWRTIVGRSEHRRRLPREPSGVRRKPPGPSSPFVPPSPLTSLPWREAGTGAKNLNGAKNGLRWSIPNDPGTVTGLLMAWRGGNEAALEQLVPLVHEELHRIARGCMRGERPGHSLQATALVNEAYMRLMGAQQVDWQNRVHFLAVSARLMRRILVDFATVEEVSEARRRRRSPSRSMKDSSSANRAATSSRSTRRSTRSPKWTNASPRSSRCASSAD